ncbi:MAG: D-aminoacyl-tRNA deacylase [Candidatus Omnitrophica bacterium]|nr:D-aminoacyl-tRNA deacylase [Candidatus Omnitrophota bacterium]
MQRIREAVVTVGGREVARIGAGLLALAGFQRMDTEAAIAAVADRLLRIRLFDDPLGRMTRPSTKPAGKS